MKESKLRSIIREQAELLLELDMDYMLDGRTYKMQNIAGFHAGYVQPDSSGNVLQRVLSQMGVRGVSKGNIRDVKYFSSNGQWRLDLDDFFEYYNHVDGELNAMSGVKKAKVVSIPSIVKVSVVPSNRPGKDLADHPQFVADYIEANR